MPIDDQRDRVRGPARAPSSPCASPTAIALLWRLIDTSACVPDRTGVANAERRRGSRASCGAGEVVAWIA
jgi:hypothetical protein